MNLEYESQLLLTNSPFYQLRSRPKLHSLLSIKTGKSITKNQLRHFIDLSSQYTIDYILQKDKVRQIDKPNEEIIPILKKISKLLKYSKVPSFVYGIISEKKTGKKLIDSDNRHSKHKEVWEIDIKNYTHSILSRRVFWFFKSRLECAYDIAGILTKLSTFNGKIPVGAPHSNSLAYYVMSDMWNKIAMIATEKNYHISLFHDDLVISGHSLDFKIINKVKIIIKKHGFHYHKEKFLSGQKYAHKINKGYGSQVLDIIG